jgi:elongation factor G
MANIEDIRNIAFCGHGSAGKTTLVDQLLVKSGAVIANPSVDGGTSICDFDPEEKVHQYSIEASVVHLDHGGARFNIIDTPGYPDFIGQAIGGLAGVDTAAVVINAQSGIEVNTRRVFDIASEGGLGKFIIINKMDAENIDFDSIVDGIREMWGKGCILLNVPVGHGADFSGVIGTLDNPAETDGALADVAHIHEQLLEAIIEVDEEVMERFFDGQQPTQEELKTLIVRAVAEGSLVPIVCCSARTGVGLDELLDALLLCGLSPADRSYTASTGEEETEVTADVGGPLVAQVFKTRIDPFVQKLSFIRVFSGSLKKDQSVKISTARKPIKMAQLLTVQADQTEPVDSAGPGDIVAVAKMEDLATSTSIGDLTCAEIQFPTPMVGLAVSPKTRGDETKLSTAVAKVVDEDPTFLLNRDGQTKELVMTGMSDLHLTIVRERLQRRDKLEVITREPKIPYRETIQAPAEGSYRHKKQSGGRGQFGEVHIRMYPLPRGTDIETYAVKSSERFSSLKKFTYDEANNFLWVDSVVGGVIPGNFMPAVQKGFRERMERGVIAGYHVQDVCVEVHFGKHHDVDSSEAAFKTAASMAFRNVFQEAQPCLLEPVVKMAITVPESNVGDVYSDMSSRGGKVQGTDSAGGSYQTAHCEVPLREVTNYSRTLSSMTGGQGSYSMEFSHYEIMPGNIQQQVISRSKVEEVEDDS